MTERQYNMKYCYTVALLVTGYQLLEEATDKGKTGFNELCNSDLQKGLNKEVQMQRSVSSLLSHASITLLEIRGNRIKAEARFESILKSFEKDNPGFFKECRDDLIEESVVKLRFQNHLENKAIAYAISVLDQLIYQSQTG